MLSFVIEILELVVMILSYSIGIINCNLAIIDNKMEFNININISNCRNPNIKYKIYERCQ